MASSRDSRRTHRRGGGPVDGLALVAVTVLVALGLLNLVTLGMTQLAIRQLVIVLAGLVLLALLLPLQVRSMPALGWLAYGVTTGALIAVLVLGLGRGARRWLDIGFVTVQPSELAKITIILVLAHLLAAGYTRRRLLVAVGVAALPIALVMLQPDLGTALVLVAVVGCMLVLARVPFAALAPLVVVGLVVLPLLVAILRPYQLARLEAFLTGTRDAAGPGWAMLQAEIAIGLGGLLGDSRDPLFGLRASYLPERQHDLAFASLVHGWGLLAGIAVIVAVLVLVWRVALASRQARTREASLAAAGVAILIGVQAAISITGNLALIPMTGLPLPLFSYGGTTAAVHLAALGLVFAARYDGLEHPLWSPPRGRRRWQPRWARLGASALSVHLAGMSFLTWQVQTARGEELRQVSDDQMTRCIRLPAERGIITDRHGTPLVHNTKQHQVRVVPGLFPVEDDAKVERLADLVGESPADLIDAIDARGAELHATVATVRPGIGQQIIAAELPGVLVLPEQRRVYPHRGLLGPLLGFVGVGTAQDMDRWPDLALGAMVGRAGLEQQYDPILRGTDGRQCVYVDPRGRPVAAADRVDPIPGADLSLHLDLDLQRRARSALTDAVRSSGGDLGGAVAMDASTGAILAMVSVPAVDNNVYGPPPDTAALRAKAEEPGLPMLEHVTQVAAPPGSTFKLVTAAANVVHNTIPPNRVIPTGASFTLSGHTFRNWMPMPPHNLRQAIAWSNNVYFYQLAWQLGANRLIEVAAELGVGARTGIDLPAESAGNLRTPESVRETGGTWYPGSTVLLGIGQGPVLATPLQVARWTGALATGELVTPRLGRAIESGPDSSTPVEAPEPERLSFADKLGPVRDGMREAVTGGTGRGLSDLPVAAGAKTGSAEDPASPNRRPNSWFTAVAPMGDPEIVVTGFVRGGGMGSETAGPAVRQILEHHLR